MERIPKGSYMPASGESCETDLDFGSASSEAVINAEERLGKLGSTVWKSRLAEVGKGQ